MTYGFHRQGQSAEFPEKRKIALRPLDVSPYLPSLVSRTGSWAQTFRDFFLPFRLAKGAASLHAPAKRFQFLSVVGLIDPLEPIRRTETGTRLVLTAIRYSDARAN